MSNAIPDKGSIRDYMQGQSKEVIPLEEAIKRATHRPENPPRLIVNSNLYHRDTSGQTRGNPSRFVRILKGRDDPYIRRIIVGEQWIPLNTAWIPLDQIGYLRIRNEGGKPFNVVPTPEQVEEEESRIIDIGYMLVLPQKENTAPTTKSKRTMFDPPLVKEPVVTFEPIPMWMIHPREHMEGKPYSTFPMFLRCRCGEVSVTIVAFPD